jgi:NAD(P)-dependent dehydrogenase (short-subunit alcohol dehydrogenase family)
MQQEATGMTDTQTVLIAGATGSIGGGAAMALAKRGAKVVLLGRRSGKLNAKADFIRTALSEEQACVGGANVATLVVDFSDMESVRGAASEALGRFPTISGLILSVGVYIQKGPKILPNGHEAMFATNVMGPFLFTQLLLERMEESDGLVLHVIAPFSKKIDWDDLESIKKHRTMTAFNRTKTCNRIIAGELARRYAGKISSVAFDPTYVIDRSDPTLAQRWPSGIRGFLWHMMTVLLAKPPAVAGEPIADLMLSYRDRHEINGALFKLDQRIEKPDKAMNDQVSGGKLWDQLVLLTELHSS